MSKMSERVQTPEQLQVEIDAVKQLIDKREKWLAEPINQMKTTYMSVKNDTEALIKKLASLERTMEHITNNTPKK